MIDSRIKAIEDVVERQLCTGCGACAYVAPDRYRMTDIPNLGRRPVPLNHADAPSDSALSVCPGIQLSHDYDRTDSALLKDLEPCWGPVRKVYEGHAADPEIRFAGSSGGAASALALYCLEQLGVDGVLHIKADEEHPSLNKTTFSRSRAEILSATGSRYAPASPCDGLNQIEHSRRGAVFIGKPCDVAAVRMAATQNKALREKLNICIAFFCAGVPSTSGVDALLQKTRRSTFSRLRDVRYRGNGWPGRWKARWSQHDGTDAESSLSYDESWGFLQGFRQWRCYICPDHSGEFADIAVGDPWYREVYGDSPGSSLIVVRTERGAQVLNDAVRSGYVRISACDPSLLPRSQPNLVHARGSIWARLVALRFIGVPVPRFHGFELRQFWLSELTIGEKFASLFGTVKRALKRQLFSRIRYH
jgi:coenzyme F420 hydrogenase subunit beta